MGMANGRGGTKRTIGPTALEAFLKCGLAWTQRTHTPSTPSQLAGLMMHAAARAGAQGATQDEALKIATEEYDGEPNFDNAWAHAAELIDAHFRLQASGYRPLFVEQGARVEVPCSRDLFGFVDLIAKRSCDDSVVVVDYKCFGVEASGDMASRSVQLGFAAVVCRAVTGQWPRAVGYDILVNDLPGQSRQVVFSESPIYAVEALSRALAIVCHCLDTGFKPTAANPGMSSNVCRWCPVQSSCLHYTTGVVVPLPVVDHRDILASLLSPNVVAMGGFKREQAADA